LDTFPNPQSNQFATGSRVQVSRNRRFCSGLRPDCAQRCRAQRLAVKMLPVEHATMRLHLLFVARGLVTLLSLVANDQVSLWACWNIDELHFHFIEYEDHVGYISKPTILSICNRE